MIHAQRLLRSLLCGCGVATISGLVTELSVSSSSTTTTTLYYTAHHPLFSRRSSRRRHSSSSSLTVKRRADEWEPDHDDVMAYQQPQRSTDRPTETAFAVDPPEIIPSTPKIVVLGATGRVGRLVVRQLLELESIDMTVVAFVRNYDKAIRILYDDMVFAKANNNNKKRGPKLQIMEGDLVPPEELPGFAHDDSKDEKEWRRTADSAAKYFGNKVKDYDNRELLPDINESLQEALKGCSAVISCLGTVRPTNLWTDLLARPFWRILKADVSSWCEDGRHPYYVHYTSTRKALGYVEREQIRREAAAAAVLAEDENDKSKISVPKIRFIRISDLSVGQKPWNLVPLITNVVQSVVVRYHEMAEQLLEASSRVETIVLRPGDLVDDERDVNTTSLQVSHTGSVPFPARVSRDDVASLAVAAAMFQTPRYQDDMEGTIITTNQEAFHYTLACRWVGQHLDPFPPQGVMALGSKDATTALRRTLKVIEKNERRKRALERTRRETNGGPGDLRVASPQVVNLSHRKKQQQPHGVCVAIPVYIMLGLFARTSLHALFEILPGGPTLLVQLNKWFLFGASLIMGKLGTILPFLARRKQYISF